MSMGSLIASRLARSGHALANRAISQAPRAPLHTTSPLLSRLGSVARAFSSKPSAADVIGIDLGTTNSCVSVMEGKIKAMAR
ncbi:heat shock 70 kDa protein 10, mitochondrial-like isoform X2 [Lolium rigidum]|uniref:heat shock 70 kDa protein 10, mitochondrial-like isoform X2 n=1 Tax=Lolium rigidum TaxID=89674 RepID=UPI001F5CF206|nr:heat shock 70 kDa protein 10, mitochondrial-like isoform X2 [Lolium rigidum]